MVVEPLASGVVVSEVEAVVSAVGAVVSEVELSVVVVVVELDSFTTILTSLALQEL